MKLVRCVDATPNWIGKKNFTINQIYKVTKRWTEPQYKGKLFYNVIVDDKVSDGWSISRFEDYNKLRI